jgi:hypothetical protein
MANCIDPFKYFIDYAEWYISNNPGTTFLDVLNEPNLFPKSANLCCPTCGQDGEEAYVLSGRLDDDPGNFFSYFNITNRLDGSCCLNTYVTVELYSNILDNSVPGDFPNPCCTPSDFKSCLSQLADFLNSDEFNNYIITGNNGVVEWNTINNDTLMCNIYSVLSDKDPAVALGYILDILNNGLVIACKDEGVVITSIETYNVTYPPAPPPAISNTTTINNN